MKREDLSLNPQVEVGGKSRDGFMEHQLIFSDPLASQVGKKVPEPAERLERQARSWARPLENEDKARRDIPVVQRVVDDAQGKEDWRGLLLGNRYQPPGETGNGVWVGCNPGEGEFMSAAATPSGSPLSHDHTNIQRSLEKQLTATPERVYTREWR